MHAFIRKSGALALLLGATLVQAGDAPPAQPLAPLAFLAGYCWDGAFADGKRTDKHCYQWVYGGKFLRDRHVVSGGKEPYQGETLYFWDSEAQKIAYIYFNSDGGVSRGTLSVDGQDLLFPAERYGEGGKTREFSTAITRNGADGYVSVTHEVTDGKRVEAWRTSFKRGATVSSDG